MAGTNVSVCCSIPARIRLLKQFLQDYIEVTDEDDTVATSVETDLDGSTCATSADVGNLSQRAEHAVEDIETLYRIQDLKILYQKVVLRFRREILMSHADPSKS
jgi:hypothetical protein